MLRLTHTLARKPGTLSGGEQQRCAIGRALIRRPQLLLLDEPLTNLDAKLRHDTRAEFKRLHRELGTTTIVYATPDQLEALSMGRRVGVLRQGRIVQVATPQALCMRHRTTISSPRWSAIRRSIWSPATLRRSPAARRIELPFARLDASPWAAARRPFPGRRRNPRRACGRRRSAPVPAAAGPRFPARVFLTEPLGDVTILDIVRPATTRACDGAAAGAGCADRAWRPRSNARSIRRQNLPVRPGDRNGHSSRRGEATT